MKTVKGNLIKLAEEGQFDVIVHGCNCQCKMGKGLAKQIKETFPSAYEADLKTVKGDRKKLGSYSWVKVRLANGKHLYIVNAYIQFWYSSDPNDTMLSMRALDIVMFKIAETFKGKKIGMPMIGTGLASGEWKNVSKCLEQHFSKHDLTIVQYDKKS